jgi:glutamyl-Q tRNA(Asp) synthetase
VNWTDRRLGAQAQNVADEVGDFVLKRADGLWAYQLAVVVDDAAQGISCVVRGQDLTDNTARQILLQEALGLPHPHYLHTPLVLGVNGEKLSKQNGAKALDLSSEAAVCKAMNQAAAALGLDTLTTPLNSLKERPSVLAFWTAQWALLEATKIGA